MELRRAAEAEEPRGLGAVSMELPWVAEAEGWGRGSKHGTLWGCGGEVEERGGGCEYGALWGSEVEERRGGG